MGVFASHNMDVRNTSKIFLETLYLIPKLSHSRILDLTQPVELPHNKLTVQKTLELACALGQSRLKAKNQGTVLGLVVSRVAKKMTKPLNNLAVRSLKNYSSRGRPGISSRPTVCVQSVRHLFKILFCKDSEKPKSKTEANPDKRINVNISISGVNNRAAVNQIYRNQRVAERVVEVGGNFQNLPDQSFQGIIRL